MLIKKIIMLFNFCLVLFLISFHASTYAENQIGDHCEWLSNKTWKWEINISYKTKSACNAADMCRYGAGCYKWVKKTEKNTYQITSEVIGIGSISPESLTLDQGKSTTFKVNAGSGYHITSIAGCEGILSGSDYRISNMNKDCKITLKTETIDIIQNIKTGHCKWLSNKTWKWEMVKVYKTKSACNSADMCRYGGACYKWLETSGKNTYQITSEVEGLGSIRPASLTINQVDNATFEVNARRGYHISSISGCNGTLSGNSYAVNNVQRDCKINLHTEQTTYQITSEIEGIGSISPANLTISQGDNATFEVNAGSGYHISSISGCNGTLSGNSYAVNSVQQDCKINLHTEQTTYQITSEVEGLGSISPVSLTVDHGESATFRVNAASGYHISSVLGCHGKLSGLDYIVSSVHHDCKIRLVTEQTTYQITSEVIGQGSINPASLMIKQGESATFKVNAASGYHIKSVSGCYGRLSGSNYHISNIQTDCLVTLETIDASAIEVTGNEYCEYFSFRENAWISLRSVPKFVCEALDKCSQGGVCYRWVTKYLAFKVQTNTDKNSQITPSDPLIKEGESATFKVETDHGYQIKSISGCGGNLNGNKYIIKEVNHHCQISVQSSNLFSIKTNLVGNGSISHHNPKIKYGENITFDVTPDSGNSLYSATGCNGELVGDQYIVNNLKENCTIQFSFLDNALERLVTTKTVGKVKITPSLLKIPLGGNGSLRVLTENGYIIDSITGCSGELDGGIYVIENIQDDCEVEAITKTSKEEPSYCLYIHSGNKYYDLTKSYCDLNSHYGFRWVIPNENYYHISAEVEGEGSIYPVESKVLKKAKFSKIFTVSHGINHKITSVTGCGGVLSGNKYTVDNVNADCLIKVNITERGEHETVTVSKTKHMQITLNTEASPARQIEAIVNNIQSITHPAEVRFDDITFVKLGNDWKITNKTPSPIKAIPVHYGDGNDIGLLILNQVLPKHSSATLTFPADTITGLSYLDQKLLYKPHFTINQVSHRDPCNNDGGGCFMGTLPNETVIFETAIVNIHEQYNRAGIFEKMNSYLSNYSHCSKYSECLNANSTFEYALNAYYRLATTRQSATLKSWVKGPIIGVLAAVTYWNGERIMAIIPESFDSTGHDTFFYNVIHHEVAHLYDFSHESGLTYGFSEDVFANQIIAKVPYSQRVNPVSLSVPKLLLKLTPAIDGKNQTFTVKFISADDERAKKVKLSVLSKHNVGFTLKSKAVSGEVEITFDKPLTANDDIYFIAHDENDPVLASSRIQGIN